MAVRIGTAEPESTFKTQGEALKGLLDDVPGVGPVTVEESPAASIDNANRLHQGEINFGFMAANWIGRAREGDAPFRQPIDLRIAAPMNAGPLFFIVRADSLIRHVGDLRGKRVIVGPERSGMTQHAHSILPAIGIKFENFTPIYLDFAAGAEALKAGKADAQLQCPIPNKVMTALSDSTDIRVLPYEPQDLRKVLAAVPFYRPTVMRMGAFRGLTADVEQPAVVNLLMTHAREPDARVGALAAAIASGTKDLARRNALFDGMDRLFTPMREQGAAACEFGGVMLHSGAAAAYRKLGLLA